MRRNLVGGTALREMKIFAHRPTDAVAFTESRCFGSTDYAASRRNKIISLCVIVRFLITREHIMWAGARWEDWKPVGEKIAKKKKKKNVRTNLNIHPSSTISSIISSKLLENTFALRAIKCQNVILYTAAVLARLIDFMSEYITPKLCLRYSFKI